MSVMHFIALLPIAAAALAGKTLYKCINNKSDLSAKVLFAVITGICITQAIGLSLIPLNVSAAAFFADLFLVGAYFFFPALMVFVYRLTFKSKLIYAVFIYPLALTILHAMGLMTDGYVVAQYSLMHNDGELNYLFSIELLFVVAAFVIAYRGFKFTDDNITLSKNLIVLYSVVPLAVFTGILLALSSTQYAISATFTVPVIMIYSTMVYGYISNPVVKDVSTGISHLPQRLKNAHKALFVANGEELRESLELAEKQLIKELFIKYKGNVDLVAADMKLSKSTVYNKINEYKIREAISLVKA